MVYRGHVVNGLVKLDESVQLPEGAEVKVELVRATGESPVEQEVRTLYERLRSLAGAAKGLPPDTSGAGCGYGRASPSR